METLEYVEAVIERAHRKTLEGELKWADGVADSLAASLTPAIKVIIDFKEEGPSSGTWTTVFVSFPVGRRMAMMSNPTPPNDKLANLVASGDTLDRLNQIFEKVFLGPRRTGFEAAMRELRSL